MYQGKDLNNLKIPNKKPRNPIIPLVIKRKAGKHRDKKKEQKSNPIEGD